MYTRKARAALIDAFGNATCSSVYESESVGFKGSAFYNWVAKIETTLSIAQVVEVLKDIEQSNGRKRTAKKFSSRTLDLDLLLYDDVVVEDPVVLPRGEILYNAFVLQPMAELVPDLIHPVCHKSYSTLWQEFDKTTQKLWPIDFAWSTST